MRETDREREREREKEGRQAGRETESKRTRRKQGRIDRTREARLLVPHVSGGHSHLYCSDTFFSLTTRGTSHASS